MAFMSLFQAWTPQNVMMFDEKIQELVNFDFLPTDFIFEAFHVSKPEQDDEDNEDEEDERALESDSTFSSD